MRRTISWTLLAAFALANVGCVVAVGNRGRFTAKEHRKQAVAVDGSIYIVDVCNYRVKKLDADAVAAAETVEYVEETITESTTTETSATQD